LGPFFQIANRDLSGRILDRVLLQRPVLCRGETRSTNFWRGVLPVEAVLGLDSYHCRRIIEFSVFASV
jgi:hypothetical protein